MGLLSLFSKGRLISEAIYWLQIIQTANVILWRICTLSNYDNNVALFIFLIWPILEAKGQLISKRFFEVIDFLQKMNENSSHSSKNEFIRVFFGRIHGLTICIRN